jgi:hypothetical protein
LQAALSWTNGPSTTQCILEALYHLTEVAVTNQTPIHWWVLAWRADLIVGVMASRFMQHDLKLIMAAIHVRCQLEEVAVEECGHLN